MTTLQLSPQQSDFVNWVKTGKGSAILEAVAGAGKTFSILKAIQATNVQCAVLAYNKKIAEEIKDKLQKAGIDWKRATAGTVHSFGFSAYRKQFPHVKVENFKVADLFDALNGLPEDVIPFRSIIVQLVSLAKQRAIGVLGSISNRELWFDIIDHFDPVQHGRGCRETRRFDRDYRH